MSTKDLVEYFSFGWDSKLYIYVDHILLSYTFSSQKIEWKDVQKIEKTKNSIIINTIEISGFSNGLIDGIYQILIDIYNKESSSLLFKVNSSLYIPASFSYSKTALVLWKNGKIEKCFPKQNLEFLIFEKPYHFKIQDNQFEVEFFHFQPFDILKEFLTHCPNIKVDISCPMDEKIDNLFKSNQGKSTRKSGSLRSIGNNKLEHQNLQRPKRKKKVPVQKKEGSSYEWVYIEDVPEDYNLFDLETLMDCPFKKWMKFGKKTYLCFVKSRKVKDMAIIKIPSPIRSLKKMDYDYVFSKCLQQYYIQLHDTVIIGESKATIEWIGHEDDHIWIGLEYEKGDTNGVFRGKKRFNCKTQSLFITIDYFQFQTEIDWQKRKSVPLFNLFKKKKERPGLPIYVGEPKKKKKNTDSPVTKNTDSPVTKSPDSPLVKKDSVKKTDVAMISFGPRPEIKKEKKEVVEENKVAEVVEEHIVKENLIEVARTDVKITEDGTNIFEVDKNNKESNIKDFTNLTRARRKKNIRVAPKVDVSDLIEE